MSDITLKQIDELLDEKLKNVATKEDLKRLKADIEEKIELSEVHILQNVDKNKADTEKVEGIEKRIDQIRSTLHSA